MSWRLMDMSPPREWTLALWQSRGKLQLLSNCIGCSVWLLHHTGRHSRRQTQYYFVLSSIYQTLNISFGGTVVRTAKLHFFVCLYQPFLTTLGCTVDFSRVRELSKASHGASAFHHTPVHAEKGGSACKWNTQTLYLFIPALSKSALLDSQLYFL